MKKEVYFGKRGQMTLFILLGIIVLASVGMYIYFKAAVTKEANIISTDYFPVKSFVESCIRNTAEEGIKILGLNGGYITFPLKIERNPNSYLSDSPILDLKNPYWWYEGVSAVPTELFITNQIEEYVTNELNTCLGNFEELKGFEVTKIGSPETKVVLAEDGVLVKLSYPLLVKREDQSVRIEEHLVEVPIRLKKVFETARMIMEKENRDMFIEKKTIDLISMDDSIPVSEMFFTCDKKQWLLSDIKEKITKLLRTNLPYIKIKGTDYNPGAYVPTPTGAHNYANSYYNYHYVWDIDEEEKEDLSGIHVSFQYDDKWPLVLYARPSSNGILRSNADKGQDALSFFCMHIAHFTYDIIYPVMTTIVDEKTEKYEGFMFKFPFKVSVDHNQPYRENFGHTLLEGEDIYDSTDYCAETRNEISIYTVDKTTQQPIADVDITFTCGRFACEVGKSSWLGYGATAELASEVPYCTQAVVSGNKEGYIESKMFVQSDIDGKSYTLELTPIKEFDKYFVTKHTQSMPALEDYLRDGEKAMITLSIPDKDYETFGVYPSDAKMPIKLLANEDNTYVVNVYVTKDDEFIGGYSGEWFVSADDLRTSDELKFHAILSDANSDEERYVFLSGLNSYSEQVPAPELR